MSENEQNEKKRTHAPFHQEYAQKVIAAMREGNAPWQKPLTGEELSPVNPESKTVYKGVNLIHLTLAGEQDPRWMTVAQANHAEMNIKKGSRGTPIVYFQWAKDETTPDGGKQRVMLDKPVFKVTYAFNASQIEGMPPLEKTEKTGPENVVERTEALLRASGANIVHDRKPGQAYYDQFKDVIHMPPPESYEKREQYLAEAVHQLAHWTGHEFRFDRQSGPNGSTARCREELRGEIAAWLIKRELGLTEAHENHKDHEPGIISLLEKSQYEILRLCRDAEDMRCFVMGLKKDLGKDKAADREAVLEREGPQTVAAAMPTHDLEGMKVLTPEQEFAAALEKAGLDLEGRPIVWDGVTQVIGNGSYSCTKDVVPEGVVRNHDTGVKIGWTATGHVLSSEALQTQREAAKTLQQERRVERENKRGRGRKKEGLENAVAALAAQGRDQGQDRGLSL